jgi:transposase
MIRTLNTLSSTPPSSAAHQHASGRKRGAQNQAIGRSRGGLTTKIHLAVRGLGCPVRFFLTAGQAGDAPQAQPLVEGLAAEIVMADAAYDSDAFRATIAAKGAQAVIPNNPSRAQKYPLDKPIYAERHLVECCFSKLKTVQARRNPIREDRQKLLRRRHYRCNSALAKVTVHTT